MENLALRLTVENREAELEELQSSVARLKASMAQRDEQVADLRRALSEVEEGARERERSLLARLLEMKRELARAKRHAGEGNEETDKSEVVSDLRRFPVHLNAPAETIAEPGGPGPFILGLD